ncbi:MAG: DNA-3-methyladenine glycosylase [Holophagaceae bacterium]|nr:DNA-3-methyladenine glycosylase [Holophagaceae bacterium]
MLRPGKLIPQSFYRRDVDLVARGLLGHLLVRDDVVLRITETEAYGGPEDSASHVRHGRTERNAIMWEKGGHAYLYLCYGLHWMLNVVTGEEGQGAAVLIRACEPVTGVDTLLARRMMSAVKPALLAGPGRVAQGLSLDKVLNGEALFRKGDLELREGDPPGAILSGPRVGIAFATPKDQQALRRYAVSGTPWISSPKLS